MKLITSRRYIKNKVINRKIREITDIDKINLDLINQMPFMRIIDESTKEHKKNNETR